MPSTRQWYASSSAVFPIPAQTVGGEADDDPLSGHLNLSNSSVSLSFSGFLTDVDLGTNGSVDSSSLLSDAFRSGFTRDK